MLANLSALLKLKSWDFEAVKLKFLLVNIRNNSQNILIIKCYVNMFNMNSVTENLPFVAIDKMEPQEVPENEGSDIDLLFHKSSLIPLGFL